jgi:hypothetical protein
VQALLPSKQGAHCGWLPSHFDLSVRHWSQARDTRNLFTGKSWAAERRLPWLWSGMLESVNALQGGREMDDPMGPRPSIDAHAARPTSAATIRNQHQISFPNGWFPSCPQFIPSPHAHKQLNSEKSIKVPTSVFIQHLRTIGLLRLCLCARYCGATNLPHIRLSFLPQH